jgi:hypothetical protein
MESDGEDGEGEGEDRDENETKSAAPQAPVSVVTEAVKTTPSLEDGTSLEDLMGELDGL